MTELTLNDLHFLVALLASEEAPVAELKSEFDAWGVKAELIQEVLEGLMNDGTIGITNLVEKEFKDFSLEEGLVLTRNWLKFVASPYQLFLTDSGFSRWDVDDWGITIRRAKFLVFSNKGSSVRV